MFIYLLAKNLKKQENVSNVREKEIENMQEGLGMDSLTKKFFEFIRRQPCALCGRGNFNEQKGEWQNTVSHIIKRGSTKKDNHFNNILSMCATCHLYDFETWPRSERMEYLELAHQATSAFLLEVSPENRELA